MADKTDNAITYRLLVLPYLLYEGMVMVGKACEYVAYLDDHVAANNSGIVGHANKGFAYPNNGPASMGIEVVPENRIYYPSECVRF